MCHQGCDIHVIEAYPLTNMCGRHFEHIAAYLRTPPPHPSPPPPHTSPKNEYNVALCGQIRGTAAAPTKKNTINLSEHTEDRYVVSLRGQGGNGGLNPWPTQKVNLRGQGGNGAVNLTVNA